MNETFKEEVQVDEEEMDCEHVFEDVTEERRSLIAKGELPRWAKILIEKEDSRWVKRRELWKALKFEKCASCGLLRITDQPEEGN